MDLWNSTAAFIFLSLCFHASVDADGFFLLLSNQHYIIWNPYLPFSDSNSLTVKILKIINSLALPHKRNHEMYSKG